jgi:hypothetical protein
MNHAYKTLSLRGLWLTALFAMACALAVAIGDVVINGATW